jgi:hypothetical protein
MNYTDIKPDQTEEKNILMCDISAEALETATDTERENAGKITWYYCPTGLTICRGLTTQLGREVATGLRCPLLALSGHQNCTVQCLLSG